MDLNCFVIVLPRPGVHASGGTGYLLSRDLILTAAHLVGKAGSTVFVRVGRLDEKNPKPLPATVEVRTEDDLGDIAILRLEEALSINVPTAGFVDIDAAVPRQFKTRGWGRAAPKGGAVRDSLLGLSGKVEEYGREDSLVQLTSVQVGDGKEDFSGVCGAPVFEEESPNRLLGVICGGKRNVGNVQWASPIFLRQTERGNALLLGPEFVWDGLEEPQDFAKLPWQEGQDRRDQIEKAALGRRLELIETLRNFLRNSPPATQLAIADQREDWRDRFGSGGLDALVETMVNVSDLYETMASLEDAQILLVGSGLAVLPGAKAIADMVLAVVLLYVLDGYRPELADDYRAARTALEASDRGLAGMLGALWDKTFPIARSEDGRNLLVEGMEHLPGEEGFDLDDRDKTISTALALDNKYLAMALKLRKHLKRADLERLERLRQGSWQEAPDIVEELYRNINQALEEDARFSSGGRRKYAAPYSKYATENRDFLDRLAEKLSALHIIELREAKDYGAESRVCSLLSRVLYRCNALLEERKP